MWVSVAYQSTCTFMACELEGVCGSFSHPREVSEKKGWTWGRGCPKKLRNNGAGGVYEKFSICGGGCAKIFDPRGGVRKNSDILILSTNPPPADNKCQVPYRKNWHTSHGVICKRKKKCFFPTTISPSSSSISSHNPSITPRIAESWRCCSASSRTPWKGHKNFIRSISAIYANEVIAYLGLF